MYKFTSLKKGDYIESQFLSIAHGLRSRMFGQSKDVVKYINEREETIYIPSDFHACYQPDLDNPLELKCDLVTKIEEKYLQWPHLIRLNKRKDFCANECLNSSSNNFIEFYKDKSADDLYEYFSNEDVNEKGKKLLENLIQSHMNQIIYKLTFANEGNDKSTHEIYRIIMELETKNKYNPFNESDKQRLLADVRDELINKISRKDRMNIMEFAKHLANRVKSEITNLSDIISFALSSLWINDETLKKNKNKFISIIHNLKSFFFSRKKPFKKRRNLNLQTPSPIVKQQTTNIDKPLEEEQLDLNQREIELDQEQKTRIEAEKTRIEAERIELEKEKIRLEKEKIRLDQEQITRIEAERIELEQKESELKKKESEFKKKELELNRKREINKPKKQQKQQQQHQQQYQQQHQQQYSQQNLERYLQQQQQYLQQQQQQYQKYQEEYQQEQKEEYQQEQKEDEKKAELNRIFQSTLLNFQIITKNYPSGNSIKHFNNKYLKEAALVDYLPILVFPFSKGENEADFYFYKGIKVTVKFFPEEGKCKMCVYTDRGDACYEIPEGNYDNVDSLKNSIKEGVERNYNAFKEINEKSGQEKYVYVNVNNVDFCVVNLVRSILIGQLMKSNKYIEGDNVFFDFEDDDIQKYWNKLREDGKTTFQYYMISQRGNEVYECMRNCSKKIDFDNVWGLTPFYTGFHFFIPGLSLGIKTYAFPKTFLFPVTILPHKRYKYEKDFDLRVQLTKKIENLEKDMGIVIEKFYYENGYFDDDQMNQIHDLHMKVLGDKFNNYMDYWNNRGGKQKWDKVKAERLEEEERERQEEERKRKEEEEEERRQREEAKRERERVFEEGRRQENMNRGAKQQKYQQQQQYHHQQEQQQKYYQQQEQQEQQKQQKQQKQYNPPPKDIPFDPMNLNHCQTLLKEILKNEYNAGDKDAFKKNFRLAIRKVHPDKAKQFGMDEKTATELTKKLTGCYEIHS